MPIVKVEKSTYTVEPLYQWDINQQLVIYGLSLASVPEVHFTNAAMGRAIVRQPSMDAAGVLTVDVPNSLLQHPYKIQVYVCVHYLSTAAFETLYKIEVPVKERKRPQEYELIDDPEVYSFEAMERELHAMQYEVNRAVEAGVQAVAAGNQATNAGKAAEQAAKDAKEAAQLVQTTADDALAKATDPGLVKYSSGAYSTIGGDSLIVGDARIAHGSYEGAGEYRESNAIVIPLDFPPRVLFVACSHRSFVASYGDATPNTSASNDFINTDWTENSVSFWDTDSPDEAFNASGTTYYWTVIG